MAIAVFPGSFDPITIGHEDIIKRVSVLFDKIIIGIGNNSQKQYMFPVEKRKEWVSKTFASDPKIEIMSYEGLTVDFCKKVNAAYLVRGLRNASDFEFEQAIAQMNRAMAHRIETIFIPCKPEFTAIASTIVRDILKHGGVVSMFVPAAIKI